jgi:hypothetical protein
MSTRLTFTSDAWTTSKTNQAVTVAPCTCRYPGIGGTSKNSLKYKVREKPTSKIRSRSTDMARKNLSRLLVSTLALALEGLVSVMSIP